MSASQLKRCPEDDADGPPACAARRSSPVRHTSTCSDLKLGVRGAVHTGTYKPQNVLQAGLRTVCDVPFQYLVHAAGLHQTYGTPRDVIVSDFQRDVGVAGNSMAAQMERALGAAIARAPAACPRAIRQARKHLSGLVLNECARKGRSHACLLGREAPGLVSVGAVDGVDAPLKDTIARSMGGCCDLS
jgi:hypothetical protein